MILRTFAREKKNAFKLGRGKRHKSIGCVTDTATSHRTYIHIKIAHFGRTLYIDVCTECVPVCMCVLTVVPLALAVYNNAPTLTPHFS